MIFKILKYRHHFKYKGIHTNKQFPVGYCKIQYISSFLKQNIHHLVYDESSLKIAHLSTIAAACYKYWIFGVETKTENVKWTFQYYLHQYNNILFIQLYYIVRSFNWWFSSSSNLFILFWMLWASLQTGIAIIAWPIKSPCIMLYKLLDAMFA